MITLYRKTGVGIKILLRVVKWCAAQTLKFLFKRFATHPFPDVFSIKPTSHV